MEAGYIVDEGYGTRTVAKWIAGEPERSMWTGLKVRDKAKARRHDLSLPPLRLPRKLRLAGRRALLTLLQLCCTAAAFARLPLFLSKERH